MPPLVGRFGGGRVYPESWRGGHETLSPGLGARGTGEAYAQTMSNDQFIHLPPPKRKVRRLRLALMITVLVACSAVILGTLWILVGQAMGY